MKLPLALLFLMIPFSSVTAEMEAVEEHTETVAVSGHLLYQRVGLYQVKANETLGSFVDSIGGIVRSELGESGNRKANPYAVILIRGKEKREFKFGRDDKAVWEFALRADDSIIIATSSMIEPLELKREELELLPLRFTKQ